MWPAGTSRVWVAWPRRAERAPPGGDQGISPASAGSASSGAERKKRVGQFSAGMRKRLAFAAAVIHAPDLLFLDEPFESIDPAGASLMKEWLQRMTEQGRTVFLTTHVLETAERLCHQAAIIMHPGKVLWQGNLDSLSAESFIAHDGIRFRTLDKLFLHLMGERKMSLNWL